MIDAGLIEATTTELFEMAIKETSDDVAAIRAWTQGWHKCGIAIGLAGFLAFVMTAFTSRPNR
jgi:hypothetical protein